jgi:glycosyltransferase involved in cell wall biosynthesis
VLISAYDLLIERFATMFDTPLHHQIRSQMRRCIAAADGVICNSETTKTEILDFYQTDAKKLYVVPLAHSDVFRSIPQSDRQNDLSLPKPFFLYVGGRKKYKNFDTVIAAYENWAHKDAIDLVVVGPEWSSAETEVLKQKKLHHHVRRINHADDETLCLLYNRAQALIYPSLYEGFGLPPLEAMACGCPVIASRIPSTVEVAGDIPFYFEPSEPESLRDALDTALSETHNTDRITAGFSQMVKVGYRDYLSEVIFRELFIVKMMNSKFALHFCDEDERQKRMPYWLSQPQTQVQK